MVFSERFHTVYIMQKDIQKNKGECMNKRSVLPVGVSGIIIVAAVVSIVYLQQPSPIIKTQVPLADDTNATASSVISLVEALNDFSVDFYQTIAESEDGNIFFSPYSIFTALSMVYEGANGTTAEEMHDVLSIAQHDDATLGSFGRLYNLLNQNQEGYTISTANAFWTHEDYEFLQSYLDLLHDFYLAEGHELDFAQNVEAAEIINTWIENHTNDKIKNMIQPEVLSDMTKLVLTNAIYFKGLWDQQFDPDNTYDADFTLATNETVTVDMMVSDSDNNRFNYTETDTLQLLKLYYQERNLSMIIVLPKENNISWAESAMTAENLSTWNEQFYEREIPVYLPKFKFETKYTLNDLLIEMGMVDAFAPGIADFSGMDGTMNLFISKVLHQAYIEINEEGTEAAAATAVIMDLTAIPDYFMADHPFMFLIQHEETGAVLFMGTVMDPSA